MRRVPPGGDGALIVEGDGCVDPVESLWKACGRWWREFGADPLIDTLIVPPVQKYAGADEALAQRARRRRDAAATLRRRAEAVVSGSSVNTVLPMVKRGCD